MRVLHVITGLNVGGAETQLESLLDPASVLDQLVVSLLPPGTVGRRMRQRGWRVEYLRAGWTRPSSWVTAPRDLRRIARDFQPAVVQGWMYHGNLATLWLAGTRIPMIWTVHSTLPASPKWSTRALVRALARLSRRPAAIVYCSRRSARQHEQIGYQSSKTQIIPNGVDLDCFQPCEATRAAVRQELGLPAHARAIVMLARYDPVKNHEMFMAAAHAVHQRASTLHWVLVGRGLEPATARARWEQRFPGAEFWDRVHLLGEREDVPRVLQGMDILTSCSRREAFSVALIEAMASRLACVATDVGDSAWALDSTGQVIASGDQAALEACWLGLASMDAVQLRHWGDAARARARDQFDIRSIRLRYAQLQAEVGLPRLGARGELAAERNP